MIIYPESQDYYPEIFQRYNELSDEFNLEDYEKGDYEVILIYKNNLKDLDTVYSNNSKIRLNYPATDIRMMSLSDFYKIYSDRFLIPVSDEKADNIINLLDASKDSGKANRSIVKQLSYTYDLLSNVKIREYLEKNWAVFSYELDQLRKLLTELNKFNYYDNRNS